MNEEKLCELWGKVGFIVNLSQMIEYNIANILAFDELLSPFNDKATLDMNIYNDVARRADELYKNLSKKTLGFGVNKMFENGILQKNSEKFLTDVYNERNYVVHSLFKDDLRLKKLETDPTYYFDRLENLIEKMSMINNQLCEYLNKQKLCYKQIQ